MKLLLRNYLARAPSVQSTLPMHASVWQPRSCPAAIVNICTSSGASPPFHHIINITPGITYCSILAANTHYQHHIATVNMGDLPEQQNDSLAAIENNEGLQPPSSPATTPTAATHAAAAPAAEAKKKKGKLSILLQHKKDKANKSAKTSTTLETAAEGSKAVADVTPAEEAVSPAESADEPTTLQTTSRRSSAIFDNINSDEVAGPSSSAPPPAEGVASEADPSSSVPTIMITPPTPRAQSIAGSVNGDLLQAPKRNRLGRAAVSSSKTADDKPKFHLKIPEGPNDYPYANSPRNIKRFGWLTYETRHLYIPLARHWVEYRPVAKYAGAPLFRLCKACPYILVPQILAARMQLLIETPFLLPDEVKELAAQRGLDVASLEGYDLALLNILGALWND